MSPEELEAFRLNIAINEPSQVVLEEKALRLIDRQAARITKLVAQVAALQEIAINERERRHISVMGRFGFVLDSETSPDPRKLAEDQLAKEHPEAFR